MEYLGKKVVVEYQYNDKEEAEEHEKLMLLQGWKVESVGHLMFPNFRSYFKRQRQGAYL